jgi:hypothetical protein
MGADLITQIVVGPEKLRVPAKKRKTLLAAAQKKLAACEAWRPSQPFPKGFADQYEVDAVADLNPEPVLTDLLALWNDEDVPRDVNSRVVTLGKKKYRVLVCGGTSWGDSPEGLGYQTLEESRRLGYLDALEIT